MEMVILRKFLAYIVVIIIIIIIIHHFVSCLFQDEIFGFQYLACYVNDSCYLNLTDIKKVLDSRK